MIKREVSDILHTRFQRSSVMITITDVDVSPDNRNARVLYSVIETQGDEARRAERFFDKNHAIIKRELSRRIVLKYMPALQFEYDHANAAAMRVHELLDSLEIEDEAPSEEDNTDR